MRVQAGPGPHPGGTLVQCTIWSSRGAMPADAQSVFLRAAPRWKRMFSQHQHSLSPPGKASSCPSAVSCREGGPGGKVLGAPCQTLPWACKLRTRSRAARLPGLQDGDETRRWIAGPRSLSSQQQQPASEQEWTSCMHFLGAPPGPLKSPTCPPVLEMTPCPRAAPRDQWRAQSRDLVQDPQIMPFPLKINTYIDR